MKQPSQPPFRVLSIDFDFFPDITKELLRHYPDGIDLPTELSSIVWATRYASEPKLHDIKINEKFYNQIIDILCNQRSDIPIMVTNSHVHAYDFIMKYQKDYDIELTNIDFHHDMINDNKSLDCGNWIEHIIKDCSVTKLRWIARQLSEKCYGEDLSELFGDSIRFTFDEIQDADFDAVFLCRSDNWLPPHLDEDFVTLVQICVEHFDEVIAESGINVPRNTDKLVQIETEIRNKITKKIPQ